MNKKHFINKSNQQQHAYRKFCLYLCVYYTEHEKILSFYQLNSALDHNFTLVQATICQKINHKAHNFLKYNKNEFSERIG